MRNNPLKYTDPSGHSVDCGLGDTYCTAGEYKPAALINLYRQNYGLMSLQTRGSITSSALTDDINEYMKSHSDYDPLKDSMLSNLSPAVHSMFTSIRVSYWMARNGGHYEDAMNLMEYYDYHTAIYLTKFDPSKVSWANVTLDVVGIPLGFLGIGEFSSAAKLSPQTINFLTDIGLFSSGVSGYAAYKQNDELGAFLSGMSAVPFIGGVASGMSLLHDLGQGSVPYYYSPSIPR